MTDLRQSIHDAIDRLPDFHIEQVARFIGLTQGEVTNISQDAGKPHRGICPHCTRELTRPPCGACGWKG